MLDSAVAREKHKVFDGGQHTRGVCANPNPFITAECIGMLQNKKQHLG